MLSNVTGHFRDIIRSLEAEAPAKAAVSNDSWPKSTPRSAIRRQTYKAGTTISDGDEKKPAILLVMSGWVASCKMLNNGMRTVLDFSLAGDVIMTGWTREAATALSPAVVVELPGPTFEGLLSYPQPISEIILKGLARRYARLAEHVVNIGRRGAVERTAHLLLELAYRINAREKDGAIGFACPLTQADLGDALGISAVHVNRVLKELREGGFVSFRGGVVEIYDQQGLVKLASFDPSYLELRTV